MTMRANRRYGPTTGCPDACSMVLPSNVMARLKAMKREREPLWHVLERLMDAYDGNEMRK